MSTKKSITKKTPKSTKRSAKPKAKRPTAGDLLRLKAAEQRAAAAYRSAEYDLSADLALARRLLDRAAKLSLAVREIAAPGPDGGGYMRAMCAAADVARWMEIEAKATQRQLLGEVAS